MLQAPGVPLSQFPSLSLSLTSKVDQEIFSTNMFLAFAMPACDMADNKSRVYLFPLQLRTKGSEKVL